VDVVGIGSDARFEFVLGHGFDRSPVRPALASRPHFIDFLRRVANGIASSLHRELPHRDDADGRTTPRPNDRDRSLSSSLRLTHRSSPPHGDEAVQIGRPSNMQRPSRKSSRRAFKAARRLASHHSNSISQGVH